MPVRLVGKVVLSTVPNRFKSFTAVILRKSSGFNEPDVRNPWWLDGWPD